MHSWKKFKSDPWGNHFIVGLRAAFIGSVTALKSPAFRARYKLSLWIVFLMVVNMFFVCLSMYIPWRVFLYFASFILPVEPEKDWITGMIGLFWQCFMFVPMVTLTTLRYTSAASILEGLYFITLRELNPSLADSQKAVKPISFGDWFAIYFRRMLRLLGLSIILWVWYHLPVLGYLAVPFAQFYLTAKSFGIPLAVIFAVLSFIGSFLGDAVASNIILFTQFWMAAVALSRELLEPYFSRLPDYRREPAILRKRYYRMMFGFALPFIFIVSIPVLGMMAWGVAQASAAALVVEILKKEELRRGKGKEARVLRDSEKVRRERKRLNLGPLQPLFALFDNLLSS